MISSRSSETELPTFLDHFLFSSQFSLETFVSILQNLIDSRISITDEKRKSKKVSNQLYKISHYTIITSINLLSQIHYISFFKSIQHTRGNCNFIMETLTINISYLIIPHWVLFHTPKKIQHYFTSTYHWKVDFILVQII